MNSPILSLRGVAKQFGSHTALTPLDLDIQDGEFLTLLGPSGCGKTTLLRLLSGFETPDTGQIFLQGKDITQVPPEKRQLHMVFQSYALFPHMTIFDNIAFGLQCQKCPQQNIEPRVMAVLQRVKLAHLRDRKPHQLSGGQQQRVAIARAIVNEPLVLLLDEPLSALDHSLRKEMQIELKTLQRRLGITFILVTHDQEEALSLSDRVAVINRGKIEQLGAPRDLYEEPHNLFVADFIGEANLFEAFVERVEETAMWIQIAGVLIQAINKKRFQPGDHVTLIVRPEDIDAWTQDEIDTREGKLPGTVTEVIYKGSTVDLQITLHNGQTIYTSEYFDEDDATLGYEIGESVFVDWKLGWEVVLPYEDPVSL